MNEWMDCDLEMNLSSQACRDFFFLKLTKNLVIFREISKEFGGSDSGEKLEKRKTQRGKYGGFWRKEERESKRKKRNEEWKNCLKE